MHMSLPNFIGCLMEFSKSLSLQLVYVVSQPGWNFHYIIRICVSITINYLVDTRVELDIEKRE
jgi:hypothetical protein